jgi:hypothetical protein
VLSARASENASSKIQQKLKKSRTLPMSTGLVMVGLVDGLFVSIQKRKQKWKKTNYKIMERITLAWGKHKNGKNQLQKAGQTREKLENKKQMPLRT